MEIRMTRPGEFRGTDQGEIVYATTGKDHIFTQGGDDVIAKAAGTGHVNGGPGLDALSFFESSAGVFVNQGVATSRFLSITYQQIEKFTGSRFSDFLSGTPGDDTLIGLEGSDHLEGNAGNDTLLGAFGMNYLDGGADDDRIEGSAERDTIIGGSGRDTSAYNDSRAEISYARNANGSISLTESSSAVDTLWSIERIELTDGAYIFDVSGPHSEFVYRLYDASFGRTPDEAGLIFWNDQINAGNVDRDSLAQLFVDSLEFDTLYPSASDEAFVTALYRNALRRSPDAEGEAFWINAFSSGTISRAEMLVYFVDSDENIARNADNYDDGTWVLI